MSTEYTLNVVERTDLGTNSVRKLRRQGLVPVNFYFHGSENKNLAVDAKELGHALHSGHNLFAIRVDKKKHHVQIKELQYHPVTDQVTHMDLMGFKMTDKITISVPLTIVGEAAGVKAGGIMVQNITHIDIHCLPTDVPEHVEVDVSQLEVGHHLSVGDLVLPPEIELLTAPGMPIVTIQTARGAGSAEEIAVAEEPEEEAEVPEEEAAPAE